MPPTIRFSQFNASLNRAAEGQIVNDFSNPAIADTRGTTTSQSVRVQQARNVAEIIQRTSPDVLLINEFDFYTPNPELPVKLFQQNFLSVSQNGAAPVNYPYFYIAPSNTGIATGFDLNNDGAAVTSITNGIGAAGYGDDAFGFGAFPGQFGMVLLSKYPIDIANVRTFQKFLWKDMPGNLLTNDPTADNPTTPVSENLGGFYSPEEQAILRLSSKSHWDVPIIVDGRIVHALVSHPTPPVFDGTEDRNGKRNFDEIRFWADYVSAGKGDYIYDDKGNKGGLQPGSSFVIMGDQNAEAYDGDAYRVGDKNAILQLLQNPNINSNFIPTSPGGPQQATLQGGANTTHRGNAAFDTADFADTSPGNLRADYILPSANLAKADGGIFWPLNTDPLFPLVGTFNASQWNGFPSSDHRLVFSDIQLQPQTANTIPRASFQGQVIFPTGFIPSGSAGTVNGVATAMGGLSGVTYDSVNNRFYAISDDRSQVGPARFYTFTTAVSPSGQLSSVNFTNATPLQQPNGSFYPALSLDPEGIALTQKGTVFVSSEGEVNPAAGRVTSPFVNEYNLATGAFVRALPVPGKFVPVVQDTNNSGAIDAGDTQTLGVRNNLAFESLTITPDQRYLFTATESALLQDGAIATLTNGARTRILQYNLVTGQPEKEYLYVTESIPKAPDPTTAAADNGLVDLLAIDNRGTLLALERSFAVGKGNTIRLYEISLQGATDISFYDSLNALTPTQLAAIQPAQKRLVLNLDDLKLATGLDNVEGLAFGPKLPDGRQSVVLVSDNNFSATQFTQILTLGADLVPTPSLLNGIASGDTTQTSTVLWARSSSAGPVKFEYSTDAGFSTIAGTATATVANPLQPVKVNITGLTSNTQYFYRVTDVAGDQEVGKFITAAAAGVQTGLRFGVAGDWRGELAPYPAIANVPGRNLAFFVEHGDTIYADDDSPILKNLDGTLKQQAETLDDFRLKHAEVYSSRFGSNTWADLRASTSVLAIIDDHEVTNDFAGGELASSDPRFKDNTPGRLINDTALFENGLQAFQEYNPLRDEVYGNTGDPRTAGERKLYRYNTYGKDAAVMVLDTRSFRDQEITGPSDFTNPQEIARVLTQSFTPGRTLLGQAQLNDLKRDLLAAQSNKVTWKFIMVPEPIQNIFPGINTDSYEGYNAERTELLKFIESNGIQNVVFVSADVHSTFVNNLTYQERAFGPQIATSAFEITTGAVAYERPTGEFLGNLFTANNPQLRAFYNSLPNAPDTDNLPNDKDDFVKQAINDNLLKPLGYDPIGLNDNLPQANGLINAKLLQGDYFVGHSYSWSEFDIDPITQKLVVTTYGIDSYSEAELLANPAAISGRTPRVLSQFEVTPISQGPATILTGPSSSQTPYVLPVDSATGVKVTSILTTGDATRNGYKMAGIPDGLGAFDNLDGTFTLLMNHELGSTTGVARAHGGKGAFVSSWVINKADLSVVSGGDLIQKVYNWDVATQRSAATVSTLNFNRFCSADLPEVSAFYNPLTGLGTQERIFMNGEEGGSTGYAVATVVTGASKGNAYILGKFNPATNGSGGTSVGGWENLLANPLAQDKTVVIGNNDGGTGVVNNALVVYVGTKQNTGSEIDKAGLTNGTIKYINVAGNAAEIVNTTTRATNITSGTRFSLSATAPTTFSRPEDGSWNPLNPNEYFFVTTDQLDTVSDGLGTQVGRSRLWRLTFDDIKNPDAGGRIDLLLDGTEGGNMFDNLTLDKAGHVLLQEDTGNAAHNAKMWQYDIATDKLTLLTKFDPARFGDANLAATAPFTVDEETSGIIDMEDILGPGWFLFDAQAHYTTGIAPELVEGGQLLALYNPALDQKLFKDTTTDVFNMPANGSKLNVSLQVKSNAVSEVGVFVVDNSSGAIRGVLPGAPGYEQLALEQIGRGNGRVIASNLAYLPSGFKLNLGDLTRILPFAADSNLRFYSLAAGTTTDDALNGKGAFQFSKVQQVKDLGGGQFTADFKDLALNITTSTTAIPTATSLQGGKQSEVLDLRDSLTAGGALKASFTVSRDAALDNLLGFYVVDDQTGRIGSLTPSDAGYLQAAMATRVPNLNLRVANQATAVFDAQLTTGKLYAPFMVIQDTVEGVLAGRTNQVYFPYASANPDKLDHIRLLGNNVFGFEDLGGGGDRDFNDMLVKVQLTA